MNESKVTEVPQVAEKLLSLALPIRVRDPILGDLAEEYLLDIVPQIGLLRAKGWYYLQVAKSINVYVWKEKGGAMAFLWSLVWLVLLIFMAMTINFVNHSFDLGKFSWILDLPSLVVVLTPSVFFGIAATSVGAAKLGLKLSFSEQSNVDRKLVKEACTFLKVTGNLSILMGLLGTLVGWLFIFQLLNTIDWANIGPAGSISLITIIYGVIFKSALYTAEMKIRSKYLEG